MFASLAFWLTCAKNAEQLDLLEKGYRVLSEALRHFLHGRQLQPPLRKATDIDEVGDTAAFLCSHLSRGITGETLFVDSGYHIVGMLSGSE